MRPADDNRAGVLRWRMRAAFAVAAGITLGLFFRRAETDAASAGPVAASGGRTMLRVAHSYNDPHVAKAFAALAAAYSRRHPGVEVKVEAMPLRVYRQWIRTQLIGGTPPDLVEPLGTGGVWEEIAVQYLHPLTAAVLEPNPYNEGTPLAQQAWKQTYLDKMAGGYFLHLMEFYAASLNLNNQRIFYNKKMFRAVQGSDDPPRDFRAWLELGARLREWAGRDGKVVAPLAVARDDLLSTPGTNRTGLFTRYFRSLTGGMMAPYDVQAWGAPDPTLLFWGLTNGSFDLKDPRIRAATGAVQRIADICQAGFSSDLPENKRFLFLQQKAAMVLGDTRDFGIYQATAGFEVGVFDFPQIARNDPEWGRYYAGPLWEGEGCAGLLLAIPRDSLQRERALDFLQFATSVRQNAAFCAELSWFPAIRDAETSADLAVFRPQTRGTINAPELVSPNSSTEVYFRRNLPLFLLRQLPFDEFMDGLAQEWRARGWADLDRMLNTRIRGHRNTEFNVGRAKARLLFAEAGNQGREFVDHDRTPYQLGLEIVDLLDSSIVRRKYVQPNLKRGDYRFPPAVAGERRDPTWP